MSDRAAFDPYRSRTEPSLRPQITDVSGNPWHARPDVRIRKHLRGVKLGEYDRDLVDRYLNHRSWIELENSLRILARNFEGEEKLRLEEAIDVVAEARSERSPYE